MTKIVNANGETCSSEKKVDIPQITGLSPTGPRLLIELFTINEAMGTDIILAEDTKQKVHQAYVLAVGPQVPEDFGVEVGDRIWIDGKITMGPVFDDNPRKVGTIEYNMAKGIVRE